MVVRLSSFYYPQRIWSVIALIAFTLSSIVNASESKGETDDHSDDWTGTTPITVNGDPVPGNIHDISDIDSFHFSAIEQRTYTIMVEGQGSIHLTLLEL